jgi:hypothetical protein
LPEQKQAMLSQLRDQRNTIVKVRAVHLPNDVPSDSMPSKPSGIADHKDTSPFYRA